MRPFFKYNNALVEKIVRFEQKAHVNWMRGCGSGVSI